MLTPLQTSQTCYSCIDTKINNIDLVDVEICSIFKQGPEKRAQRVKGLYLRFSTGHKTEAMRTSQGSDATPQEI